MMLVRETELAVMDDALARDTGVENTQASRKRVAQGKPVKSGFKKPSLDDMGPGTDMAKPLFRKNTLDEMTVGRTEKPVGTGNLRIPSSVSTANSTNCVPYKSSAAVSKYQLPSLV